MAEFLFFLVGLLIVARILRSQGLHLGNVLASPPSTLPAPDAEDPLTAGEPEPVPFSIQTLSEGLSTGTKFVRRTGRILIPYASSSSSGNLGRVMTRRTGRIVH